MDDRTDPDVLTGFVAEVANYLPTVRSAVADFAADPARTDIPEDAARMLHCIKGASGMLGFGILSRMAEHLEEYVWDLAAGRYPISPAAAEEYPVAVDLVAVTVAGLLTGHAGTDDDLARIQDIVARLGGRTVPANELFADLAGLPDMFGEAPLPIDDAFAFDLPTDAVPEQASSTMPAQDIDAELREIFRAEAEDLFRTIHSLMPELDANRGDPARVQAVRRAVHSLKGAAGAVGLKSVSQLSHRMEDLLDRLHAAGRVVSDDEFRLLQATTDALEGMTEGKADESVVARLFETYEAILAEVPDADAEGERSGVSRPMVAPPPAPLARRNRSPSQPRCPRSPSASFRPRCGCRSSGSTRWSACSWNW